MPDSKRAELKVVGMVCAACSAAIERALMNLDGVSKAEVNPALEMVFVEYDFQKLRLADLEKAIRNAGYDVIDEKVVLKIGGMVCAMCVGALEIGIKKLDGVVDVRVNLAAEKAHVTYNPRMVGLEDLKKAVADTGYQFLGVAGEEASSELERAALEKDLADKRQRIIIGLSGQPFSHDCHVPADPPAHSHEHHDGCSQYHESVHAGGLGTGLCLRQPSHISRRRAGSRQQKPGYGRDVRDGYRRCIRLQHPRHF